MISFDASNDDAHEDLIRARNAAAQRIRASLPEASVKLIDRMNHIRAQHCKMGCDQEMQDEYESLKASVASAAYDNNKEHRILFVVGDSDSGKSAMVDHCIANDPISLITRDADNNRIWPMVRMKAPSPCSLRNFGIKLLQSVGYQIKDDAKETYVWPIVPIQLIARQVQFIVVEEAQHLMNVDNESELQKLSDNLLTLAEMVDWPIRLILIGVDPLESLRNRDKQMWNRSQVIPLNPIPMGGYSRVGDWLREIVTDHAKMQLNLDVEDCSKRLIHCGEGNIGAIMKMIRSAVENALRAGRENVQKADFAQAYHHKTRCSPDDNVFEGEIWLNKPSGLARERRADNQLTVNTGNSKPLKRGERPR